MQVDGLTRDDEAALLFVHGEGFPAGRSGTVTLTGTHYGPFGERKRVELSFPCRADSARRLSVRLSRAEEAWQTGGLVEGTLEVAFASKTDSEALVAGTLKEAIVRLPSHDLRAQLRADRNARAFLDEAGIQGVDSQDGSLVVTALEPDGPAARTGLRIGDVIRRVDQAPVERLGDLVPSLRARDPRLRVQRGGELLSIPLPLGASRAQTVPFTIVWLAGAIAFIAAWVLPTRARRPAASARWATSSGGAALALVFCVLVTGGALDLRWAFGLPFVAYSVVSTLRHLRSGRDPVTLARHAALRAALPLSMAAFCLLAGGSRIDLVARETSYLSLTSWPLLAAPPAWLAWAAIAAALPTATHEAPWHERLVASWQAWSVAAAIAAFGLGASSLEPLALDGAVGPTVVWALKTVLVRVALHVRLCAAIPRDRVGALSLLGPISAGAWLMLEPEPLLTGALAGACAGVVLCLLGKQLLSATRRPLLGRSDPLLEPFR